MESGLSASDVALIGNDGFGGGNSFLWIFALLILANGGLGFGRDYGQFATAASQQEILFGQQFQNLDNKMDRLGNGIADATFALNSAITTEGRNLQTLLANDTASINATTVSQTQKILDVLAENKINDLQNKVNSLELQNAMCGVVRYPSGWTYNAGASPFCNCGGCNCGNV